MNQILAVFGSMNIADKTVLVTGSTDGVGVLLVEKVLDYRILGLHLERLADIALTSLERGHNQPLSYSRPIQGAIELHDVCFRYADTDPFVLENVNLSIAPGEFITAMVPSASCQTTLLTLMLGLL